MIITKYYLVQGVFYSSMGGHDTRIDIIDVSYDKEPLIEKIKEILVDENIKSINDIEFDEFEFDETESQWEISYKVDGSTINDILLLKIIEREE